MSISVQKINSAQLKKILALQESHFLDFKSIEIQPSKLSKTIAAFANADGGELFIGIREDKNNKKLIWSGFKTIEDGNGHLQTLNELFILGEEYYCSFLSHSQFDTLVLYLNIQKTRSIKRASDGKSYIRQGSQSLPVIDESTLRRNKGLESFESEVTTTELEEVISSEVMKSFIAQAFPDTNQESFLRKQKLVHKDKVTVCGVLLFSDLPQAIIPKHCGIKVYRYKTESLEGKREVLEFNPITIEGCAYNQIYNAVRKTLEVIESLSYFNEGKLIRVKYPPKTLHEIITNAVLHRDYSIADDIHVRIYENRIEVESPGKLPGHITESNILEERFSRNGNLVRVINKFHNPPNQDVGEGLNTAFREMQKFQLRDPVIKQEENKVVVYIYHQCLASLEETILKLLDTEPIVTSSTIRKAYYIETDYQLRKAFNKLLETKLIEKVSGIKGAYQRNKKDDLIKALEKILSPHQFQALLSIEEALIADKRKAVVSLPVGTGLKTISAALIYKLLKEHKYNKIFYIVADKASLHEISAYLETFKIETIETLSNEFEIQEIQQSSPINNSRIHLGTAQSFTRNLNNEISSEAALHGSLIILRLDHIAESLQKILGSINIPVIGLVSSSTESSDSFFKNNKVFTYTISQAIQDGYWVKPVHICIGRYSHTCFEDWVAESSIFDVQDFDNLLLIRDFNQLLFDSVLKHIDIENPGKTIVFCRTIEHASLVTDIIRQILHSRYRDSKPFTVAQITGNLSSEEILELTHRFRNEEQPKIAVTVELLTSINASEVCNLVFVRPIQSKNLYQRMLGIAARPCPSIGKQSFRIFDAVGLYEKFGNVFGEGYFIPKESTSSNKMLAEEMLHQRENNFGSDIDFTQSLIDFETFIHSQNDMLPALRIAVEKPWNLSRVQLKVLEEQLEQKGFPRSKLCSLCKAENGEPIDDSIVGFIRHVWTKEKLVPYRDRVSYAISKFLETYNLTVQQQKWVGRIRKQLELEYIVDREAFDRGAFASQGGFQYINGVFEGRLLEFMTEIHTLIWNIP